MPKRIQLSRRKGWRMPPNTVKVCRPSKFGNPWPVGSEGPYGRTAPDREGAVGFFRQMLTDPVLRAFAGYPSDDDIRSELRGKNLACWCPIDGPCHADVLLDLANQEPHHAE
ncbi:DUF4326 domain-containing protein [Devosia honganensis]|uniref:DUF4326 domain-containing protein n=1 Tax=Devosia honganensis TaxID=1610527 RepID=A0ABV7X2T0_9HYPH